jgi:hypothetical protein
MCNTFSNVKNRPNKQAKGFTKHYERREKMGRQRVTNPKHPLYKPKEKIINTLIVKGTLDVLKGYTFLKKKVILEHPIDKGYFKEVYVLSDMGKNYLQRLKVEKKNLELKKSFKEVDIDSEMEVYLCM